MGHLPAYARTFLCAFLVLGTSISLAAPGDWDASWGTNGLVRVALGSRLPESARLLKQADGKLIMWGASALPGTPPLENRFDVYVARLNPNGTLDASFNGSGVRNFDFAPLEWGAADVVEQPDGKLLVAEPVYRTAQLGDRVVVVKRINVDGSDDLTFGTGGSVTVPPTGDDVDEGGARLLVNPDGSIIVLTPLSQGNTLRVRLVRLTSGGVPDVGFGTGGSVILPSAYAQMAATDIFREASGRYILPCWVRTTPSSAARACLMRVTSGGALDTAYGEGGFIYPNGAAGAADISDAILTPSGQLILMTEEMTSDGQEMKVIRRLNADGSPDSGFGSGGRIVALSAGSIELEPNGYIVASGSFNSPIGQTAWIARYETDGSPDPSFGRGGSSYVAGLSYAAGVVRLNDGSYVATTSFAPDERALVRFHGSGAFGGTLTLLPYRGGGGGIFTRESRPEITARVHRTGGSTGTIRVDYRAVGITATAGSDFSPISGTLTWQEGDISSKDIVLPLLDDAIWEEEETFYLELLNPQGGATLQRDRMDMTLLSDETVRPRVGFYSSATDDVLEGRVAHLVVRRSGDTSAPLVVHYSTTANSATAGVDFTAASGTLTWDAYDDSSRVIEIQTHADGQDDDDERLTVQLNSTSPGIQFDSSTVSLRIYDGTVSSSGETGFSLERTTTRVSEGDSSISFRVHRYGNLASVASVNFNVAIPGSTGPNIATAGQDYTASSGTLNWGAGEGGYKEFTISLLEDSVVESPESFSVYVTPASPATSKIIRTDVEISDNDAFATAPVITLVPGTTSVQESAGGYTVTALLSGPTNHQVSVQYTLTRGTLGNSELTVTSGTLYWNPGQAGTFGYRIPIPDDTRDETDETFRVTLYEPKGASLSGEITTVVTIVDDDPTPVGAPPPVTPGPRFVQSEVSVNENAQSVTLYVDRVGDATDALSVTLYAGSGNATAPADYVARFDVLEWQAGDVSRKSVDIFLNGDADTEGDETLTLYLLPFDSGIGITDTTMQVTLLDDDNGSAQFARLGLLASAVSVDEAQQTVTLQVARSGNPNVAASVSYATTAGSATAADFDAAAGVLTWEANDTSAKQITITLRPDTADEPNEAFTVTLSSPSAGAAVDTASATITIVDDDGAGGGGGGGGGTNEPSGGKSGGGGAIDYLLLLVLLTFMSIRRHAAAIGR